MKEFTNMVMDMSLSPACVGREFVRQYYTLLNEAPAHLHRFYNNSSSFIHGSLDNAGCELPVIVGQRLIHQNVIEHLNFHDCRTKIYHVDAQATLDNGVVVQVSGEISSRGQPMRRFTQTFVLASQSPKKYYVHNDIFRYQDILPEDIDTRSENGEAEIQQNNILIQETQTAYYGNVNQVVNGMADDNHQELVHPEQNDQQVFSNIEIMQQPPVPPMLESVPVEQPSQAPQYVHVAELEQQQQQSQVSMESQQPEYHVPSPQPPTPQPAVVSNEPKTYANLLKGFGVSNSNVYYNSVSVPAQPSQSSQISDSSSPPPQSKSEKGFDSRPAINNFHGGNKPSKSEMSRNSFQVTGRQTEETTNGKFKINTTGKLNSNANGEFKSNANGGDFKIKSNGNGCGGDGDRRRNFSFSDNHQVFVGNIPHNASEKELKELFGQYGNIIDLKILSKPGSKGPGLAKLPFYGFIIFEDIGSVQAVLHAKPIMFPDENGGTIKLNVEEKKARRGGEGGRGGRGGLLGRGGSAPPRGGPRGSGGGMRFNGQMRR